MDANQSRAAIVHDFFVQDGGAERCAVEFARMIREADIVTSFYDHRRFGDRLASSRVRHWGIQRILGPTRRFRALLPVYPFYFSRMRLPHRDLVLSSSVAFAKAVRTSPEALHVAYVYTPMRYAWDLDRYLDQSSYSFAARVAARLMRRCLQRWDRSTSARPDVVVAISNLVAQRIRKYWDREVNEIIYPPVDTNAISLASGEGGFYLVAARLLAYRRIDLAIDACTQLNRRLVVVGDGPERAKLERLAGPSVQFRNWVDRAELISLFRECRAYLLPGIEDFGIAPVEAMAAGKPVIAYRAGGALETVVEGRTGFFFDEPTGDSLASAIRDLDDADLDRSAIRLHAETFDTAVFVRRWRQLLLRFGVDPALLADER